MPKEYILAKGRFKVADLAASGLPKKLVDVGETPMFEMTIDSEYAENRPTANAISGKDMRVLTSMDFKAQITCREATAKNLALFVFGTTATRTSASVANIPFTETAAAGDILRLPNGYTNVSAGVIKDSAGTPTTLVAGTDYVLDSMNGTLRVLNVTGKTQPLTFSGTVGAAEIVGAGTKRAQDKYILFEGILISQNDKPIIVEILRGNLSPTKAITFKGDKVADFVLDVECLENTDLPVDSVFGNTVKITYPTVA